MRKTVLYIAISLDGYIADQNGGVAWLESQNEYAQEPGSYPEFMQTVDTVVLGYTTYHQLITELSPAAWPYEGKQTYVMTHRSLPGQKDIHFTGEPVEGLIYGLKEQDGKDIYICGGANLANQLIKARLIDIYSITIIPIILGSGIRLFGQDNPIIALFLKSTRQYNGMIDLVFETIAPEST